MIWSVCLCGLTDAFEVNGQKTFVTYKAWSDLIQESFEKCYYVPTGMSLAALS